MSTVDNSTMQRIDVDQHMNEVILNEMKMMPMIQEQSY